MLVIKYLATTRRWRASGFLVALLVDVAYSATLSRENVPQVSGSAVFVGWFVGAVIAEWRIATVPVGERRAASLRRRRLGDYVARSAVALAAGVWSLVAAATLIALGDTVLHHRPTRYYQSVPGGLWTELALLVVAGAVLVFVANRVLRRPQPLAASDVLAADEALRRHSLYVLVGSALALAGYLSAQIVATVGVSGPGSGYQLRDALELVGILGLPIAGALVALSPRRRPVRGREAPVPA
jgi:hypothetical protein